MINENQGKEYQPKPFYNRKMVRTILRNKAYDISKSKVNRRMSNAFKQMRVIGK